MSLRAINQNLLPILLALLRERNVTRAARSVGLSQPAVSKALIQLRAILKDELLVRAGRSLILTKRGEKLLGPVEAICEDLERLWRAQTFDPATSSREFVIAGTDYCAMLMVPALAQALATQAPGITMRFVDLVPQQLLEERTDIDFAMLPDLMVPRQLVDAGNVIPLFVDDFVAVVARDHPLAAADASLADDIAGTPRIAFGNDNPLIPKELRAAAPMGLPGSPTLAIVQHFLTLPLLALLTGTSAVVPRRLVAMVAPVIPLHVLDIAVPDPPVSMVLAWHKRWDGDPDHRWFRKLVADNMSDRPIR